jgi:hypothetical protein
MPSLREACGNRVPSLAAMNADPCRFPRYVRIRSISLAPRWNS